MRVLVTGNEGYIGSVLVPLLIEQGHEVAGLDVGLFNDCALAELLPVPTLRADVRDVGPDAFRGFDAVVHLAGLANDPLGDLDPGLTYAINHEASVRVAEAARRAGVRRFLFASTCSIYGAGGEDWIDEASTPHPLTPYAKSKVSAEAAIARLADGQFCPVFLRAATAYGMSPYLRFDLALNNLVAWAHATGMVYLKSDGRSWRPFVHVQDIARAYAALLTAPAERVCNRAFNVGRTGENYRITRLAEIVAEVVPETQVVFADGASPDLRSYRVNCDAFAAAAPEALPRWSVRTGSEEVYAAIRTRRLGTEDFEGARYSRIAHIRHLVASGRLDTDLRWLAPVHALERVAS